MKLKIGAIVQARMNSARFSGKVLRLVQGKPLLGYTLERLARCRYLDTVIVATSDESADTPIVEFCDNLGINCFRGSLEDVAGRFSGAAATHDLNAFVRITGDSPLIDQLIVEKGICLYREGDYDLVTNVLPRSYPIGQSVEVISTDTFTRSCAKMAGAEREHVTQYFHRHRDDFRIHNYSHGGDISGLQLSVDTPADMEMFEGIVARMERPHWEYHLPDILEILPKILKEKIVP